MLRSRIHRSVVAPLVLGGLLLTWDGFWERLADWLQGPSESVILMSASSSGIDPDGRPKTTTNGQASSESSSGIDPLGRP